MAAFSADGGFAVRFNLTDARAAVVALNTCYDDLLKSWGVDLAQLHTAKVGPKPVGNVAGWVTNADYPTEALAANQRGEVPFQLAIGSDGRPLTCRVIHSSGAPLLDERTCSLVLRRAHFSPARDEQDKLVAGYYVISRVRWVMPD